MKVYWRRLSSSSSEDVFKTSWSRRIYSPKSYVFRRCLQKVLVKTNIFVLAISLQDNIFKMSSRCLQDHLPRRLQDFFEDFFKTSCKKVLKTSSRSRQDVLKTSSRHLQDVLQKYLQDVFKTYYQVKLFSLTRLWEAFNTFLRRSFPKTVIYSRGICLGNTTSDRFMVSVLNLQEIKISQVLVSLFYIFLWLLREAYLEPDRTSTVQWRYFAGILNFLGPLKMVLWYISQNSQENICAGTSFFDKVKLCRSAASLKTQVTTGVFLWILQNS